MRNIKIILQHIIKQGLNKVNSYSSRLRWENWIDLMMDNISREFEDREKKCWLFQQLLKSRKGILRKHKLGSKSWTD